METNETAQAARVRARLARALAQEEASPTLALALKRLQEAQAITRAEQAAHIGTTLTGLDRLALCKLPHEEQFARDCETIAEYCGCDPGALLSLLRTIQVLETFAQSAVSEPLSIISKQRPSWQGSGILIAARDAQESEESQEGGSHE